EQIDNAAVLFQLRVEKHIDLVQKIETQIVVEPRKLRALRIQQIHIARQQPLREEVIHQRLTRARVGQHTRNLFVENPRLCQSPANCKVEKGVVRNAAPQRERQARSQLDIGNSIHRPRSCPRRIRLDAEQKIGANQYTLARRASFDKIFVAQGSSSAAATGWHT